MLAQFPLPRLRGLDEPVRRLLTGTSPAGLDCRPKHGQILKDTETPGKVIELCKPVLGPGRQKGFQHAQLIGVALHAFAPVVRIRFPPMPAKSVQIAARAAIALVHPFTQMGDAPVLVCEERLELDLRLAEQFGDRLAHARGRERPVESERALARCRRILFMSELGRRSGQDVRVTRLGKHASRVAQNAVRAPPASTLAPTSELGQRPEALDRLPALVNGTGRVFGDTPGLGDSLIDLGAADPAQLIRQGISERNAESARLCATVSVSAHVTPAMTGAPPIQPCSRPEPDLPQCRTYLITPESGGILRLRSKSAAPQKKKPRNAGLLCGSRLSPLKLCRRAYIMPMPWS
jgi:hypothetical protein